MNLKVRKPTYATNDYDDTLTHQCFSSTNSGDVCQQSIKIILKVLKLSHCCHDLSRFRFSVFILVTEVQYV